MGSKAAAGAVSRLFTKYGIINISHHYRPPRPAMGIVYFVLTCYSHFNLVVSRVALLLGANYNRSFFLANFSLGATCTAPRLNLTIWLLTLHLLPS
jgi:hypothetical protein